MNRRFPIALAAILTVAAFAAIAFAWAGEHPKDLRLTGGDGWPDGLADLVNYNGRVHGFFINTSDYFFYTGEAKALNTFLQKYAALKGAPLILVLHPGRGRTHRIGVADPGIPYDWSLSIATPLRGKETPDESRNSPPTVIAAVNVMLGGNISLSALDVPLNVEVRSGGEIEEFVAHHQAKQGLLEKAK